MITSRKDYHRCKNEWKTSVSIITVCMNNLWPGLKRPESLRVQTFKNFEWVVVDGSSKDGTAGVVKTESSATQNLDSEPDREFIKP